MNNKNKVEHQENESDNSLLSNCIRTTLKKYFKDLDGHAAGNLYDMVLSEMEKPMLEVVMQETDHNLTKAAEILGLNRGTLRKKLQKYDIQK